MPRFIPIPVFQRRQGWSNQTTPPPSVHTRKYESHIHFKGNLYNIYAAVRTASQVNVVATDKPSEMESQTVPVSASSAFCHWQYDTYFCSIARNFLCQEIPATCYLCYLKVADSTL